MAFIKLFPKINCEIQLFSGIGKEPEVYLYNPETPQSLVFSVTSSWEDTVILTTGETLHELEGTIVFYRGFDHTEDGHRIIDTLRYNPPDPGDDEIDVCPSLATYTLTGR